MSLVYHDVTKCVAVIGVPVDTDFAMTLSASLMTLYY